MTAAGVERGDPADHLHVAGMQDLVNGIRSTGTFTVSNGVIFAGAGATNAAPSRIRASCLLTG